MGSTWEVRGVQRIRDFYDTPRAFEQWRKSFDATTAEELSRSVRSPFCIGLHASDADARSDLVWVAGVAVSVPPFIFEQKNREIVHIQQMRMLMHKIGWLQTWGSECVITYDAFIFCDQYTYPPYAVDDGRFYARQTNCTTLELNLFVPREARQVAPLATAMARLALRNAPAQPTPMPDV